VGELRLHAGIEHGERESWLREMLGIWQAYAEDCIFSVIPQYWLKCSLPRIFLFSWTSEHVLDGSCAVSVI
jgi:hypothetical protein